MINKSLLILGILIFMIVPSSQLSSQKNNSCGSDSYLENQQNISEYKKFIIEPYKRTSRINRSVNGIHVLPVVVHVMHHSSFPNSEISENQVHIQMRKLNADFFGTGIQFKLASSNHPTGPEGLNLACGDPAITWTNLNSGQITSPYTSTIYMPPLAQSPVYTDGVYNYIFESHPQQIIQWNNQDYLNIYVFPEISNGISTPSGVSPILGFNTNSPPYQTQGPVIDYRAFGTEEYTNDDFFLYTNLDGGRTLGHELGHWFGLLHPWGFDENDCNEGDFIADTPIQSTASDNNLDCFGLPRNECGNVVSGNNIMDYCKDECKIPFTQDQSNLMLFNLENNSIRSYLIGKDAIKIDPCSPANDDFCNAIEIPVYNGCVATAYSNFGATPTGMQPFSCGSTGQGNDIWFKVVVPSSGEIVIETSSYPGSSIDDTVLEIYDVFCPYNIFQFAPFDVIGCNDDFNGSLFARVDYIGLNPGREMYVRMISYNSSNEGFFNICAYDPSGCFNSLLYTTTYSGYLRAEADINITSSGVISNSADVHYDAGNEICLQNGFEVKAGADFLAYIDGCGDPSCVYNLVAYDSYGDGWNSGFITIYINGALEHTWNGAVGFGPTNYSFTAETGDVINIYYTDGTWDNENSIIISDCTAQVLFNQNLSSYDNNDQAPDIIVQNHVAPFPY